MPSNLIQDFSTTRSYASGKYSNVLSNYLEMQIELFLTIGLTYINSYRRQIKTYTVMKFFDKIINCFFAARCSAKLNRIQRIVQFIISAQFISDQPSKINEITLIVFVVSFPAIIST